MSLFPAFCSNHIQSNQDKLIKVLIGGEMLNTVELPLMYCYKMANQPQKSLSDLNN